MPSVVALIPARGGSKRVPRKNVRLLAGHPLLAYSIHSALESGIFTDVVVSSEDDDILEVAYRYGAKRVKRPAEYATDTSPDVQWVKHAMTGHNQDCFALLRPTSPFRTAETIQRAWSLFCLGVGHTSLRAVEEWGGPHPGKMWTMRASRLIPVMDGKWYNLPKQVLPSVYVQNASLEIAWTKVLDNHSISGGEIMPFFTVGLEGLDINTEADWSRAEYESYRLPALQEAHDAIGK